MNNKAYEVTEYASDNGYCWTGILSLSFTLAAAALGLGLAVQFVSQWIYLMFLFPFAIGITLKWFGDRMVTTWKIRNALLVGILAAAASGLSLGTIHYIEYANFRSHIQELMAEADGELKALGTMSLEESEALIAEYEEEDQELLRGVYQRLHASDSFFAYMNFQAEQGVEIGRASGSSSINLGYTLSWIYWMLEFGIVCFYAVPALMSATQSPFCRRSNAWKHFIPIGAVTEDPVQAAELIAEGRLTELTALQEEPTEKNAQLVIALSPEHPLEETVEVRVLAAEGDEFKGVGAMITYPPEAMDVLREICPQAAVE